MNLEITNLSRNELLNRIKELETAIRLHRDERGHDRCWLDDSRLYDILADTPSIACITLPPRDQFLANCSRYWKCRQTAQQSADKPATKNFGAFQVRSAMPCDAQTLAGLDCEIWQSWSNPAPLYRQLLDLFPDLILVAEDHDRKIQGATVGLIGTEVVRGYVLSIDVKESARGLGVGQALLSTLLERFSARGLNEARAMIDCGNKTSQRLFERLGFKRTEEIVGYFAPEDLQYRYSLIF